MFSGIVEGKGRIEAVASSASGKKVRIQFEGVAFPVVLGDSVSVSGVCLTVAKTIDRGFEADLGPETVARTTLGELPSGAAVNLERSLPNDGRLGGHVVLGHVDGVGTVLREHGEGETKRVAISVPTDLLRFLASQGSVAVDGVSLTVAQLNPDGFEVMLIPHTLGATTLASLRVRSRVNVEVDVLARYVERQLEMRRGNTSLPAVPAPRGLAELADL